MQSSNGSSESDPFQVPPETQGILPVQRGGSPENADGVIDGNNEDDSTSQEIKGNGGKRRKKKGNQRPRRRGVNSSKEKADRSAKNAKDANDDSKKVKISNEFLRSAGPMGTGWVGGWALGAGAYGKCGLWVRQNHAGLIVDRLVVKDTSYESHRSQWESIETWVPEAEGIARDMINIDYRPHGKSIPTEVQALYSLRNRKGSEYVTHVRGWGLDLANVTIRIYQEFCSGGDWHSMIKNYFDAGTERPNIPEPALWYLLEGLAIAGLMMERGDVDGSAAYNPHMQIVHRDIKPHNIFLAEPSKELYQGYPRSKLGDFGISIFTLKNDPWNPHFYQAGTPGYMAPELMEYWPPQKGEVTGKTDVYEVGAALLTIMNRGVPDGQDHLCMEVKQEDWSDSIIFKDSFRTYSKRLQRLVERCLQYDAADRLSFEEILEVTRACTGADPGVAKDLASGLRYAPPQEPCWTNNILPHKTDKWARGLHVPGEPPVFPPPPRRDQRLETLREKIEFRALFDLFRGPTTRFRSGRQAGRTTSQHPTGDVSDDDTQTNRRKRTIAEILGLGDDEDDGRPDAKRAKGKGQLNPVTTVSPGPGNILPTIEEGNEEEEEDEDDSEEDENEEEDGEEEPDKEDSSSVPGPSPAPRRSPGVYPPPPIISMDSPPRRPTAPQQPPRRAPPARPGQRGPPPVASNIPLARQAGRASPLVSDGSQAGLRRSNRVAAAAAAAAAVAAAAAAQVIAPNPAADPNSSQSSLSPVPSSPRKTPTKSTEGRSDRQPGGNSSTRGTGRTAALAAAAAVAAAANAALGQPQGGETKVEKEPTPSPAAAEPAAPRRRGRSVTDPNAPVRRSRRLQEKSVP